MRIPPEQQLNVKLGRYRTLLDLGYRATQSPPVNEEPVPSNRPSSQYSSAKLATGREPLLQGVAVDRQFAAVTLQLRGGEHLPLRTFDVRELDSAGEGAQVDPLLAILGALSNLPVGWRALAQLVVLRPAAPGWASRYWPIL
jgi:hypothetical protein